MIAGDVPYVASKACTVEEIKSGLLIVDRKMTIRRKQGYSKNLRRAWSNSNKKVFAELGVHSQAMQPTFARRVRVSFLDFGNTLANVSGYEESSKLFGSIPPLRVRWIFSLAGT